MEAIQKDNSRKIREAILTDPTLQRLYAKRVEIYSLAIPKVILKNGKVETIWIDETNSPIIKKIDEQIEMITQKIIKHINNEDKQI